MILLALAALLMGFTVLGFAAGYGLGRQEVIQAYEDEIAELEQTVDALIPAGVRIVKR